MGLMPVYYTTTRYNRKRKRKFSKALTEHERLLKKMGVKRNLNAESINEIPNYKIIKTVNTSDQIPSNGNKKNINKYTGTEIMGIATMHKSNLVPVSRRKDAEDISKMRR